MRCKVRPWPSIGWLAAILVCWAVPSLLHAQEDDPVVAELRAQGSQFIKAFNEAKVESLVNAFATSGELIDEEGTLYRGHKELTNLFTQFFEKFPGSKLSLEVESLRSVGTTLAIEEGTRVITGRDEGRAQVRYLAVLSKENGEWKFASIREFNDDPAPSPRQQLDQLGWLVGDWVNEGDDSLVRISYRWSEDGNFLLGDYDVVVAGKPAMKSTQRLGWDPIAGKIRGWLFDSDGGFSESVWQPSAEGWVIKSSAVMPEGVSAAATIRIKQKDADHFSMQGTDRVVGDMPQEDFEVTVTKRPPAPDKAAATSPVAPSRSGAPESGAKATKTGSKSGDPRPPLPPAPPIGVPPRPQPPR